MTVYEGPDSCYAELEGRYVKRVGWSGLDALREAVAIARLILRDYRRGFTYKQGSCEKIPMTRDLFSKRLHFLVFLARRHGAPEEVVDAVRRLVRYLLRREKLPKTIRVSGRRLRAKSLLRGMYARAAAQRKTRAKARVKTRKR